MKGYLLLLLLAFSAGKVYAQQELRIHHINIKNGDATLIGIYDLPTQTYKRTILIDGGSATPSERLLPYLRNVLHVNTPKVNYVALTHYHSDHYNGLMALKDGSLLADSIVDQGGYDMPAVFSGQSDLNSDETKPVSMTVYYGWISTLTKAVSNGSVKGHVTGLFHYGNGPTTQLGNELLLGEVNGIRISFKCVAGWGNTLIANGIQSDPFPTRKNPNNFTLAFILSYGQFRYFIGGDLGGDSDSTYIDQETPLSGYLSASYPLSWSWNRTKQARGHICGFKANHHGSEHSNSQAFMTNMSPAICVVSAGSQSSWKLPRPDYLRRLSNVTPLSVWTSSSNQIYSKGLYVTNLYNFVDEPAKTTAIELFSDKPGVSFNYGNDSPSASSGYMIVVPSENAGQKSQFQTFRTNALGSSVTLLANFFCHTL